MKRVAVIAAVGLMSASSLVQAATSTGNLSVSAIVTATCSVQNASRQAAQVGVNCSSGTAYTISLDGGNAATPQNRQLVSDGNQQNVPVFASLSNNQNISAANAGDVVGITLSY
jgi:spore coat protein U-like protein